MVNVRNSDFGFYVSINQGSGWEWIETPKPHILDTKYPHVCFKCKRELKFRELYDANNVNEMIFYTPYMKELLGYNVPLYRKLKKWWKSRVIEFYCCQCFREKDDKKGIIFDTPDYYGLRSLKFC